MYLQHMLLGKNADDEHVTGSTLKKRYEWAKEVLSVQGAAEFDRDVFDQMAEAGWVNLQEKIPINNTVCKGVFLNQNGTPAQIHLQALALQLVKIAIQVNTATFPAVTFPLTGLVDARVVLFATGEMVITGFTSPPEMYYAIRFVQKMLIQCGYPRIWCDFSQITVENVVSRLRMPAPVSKEKFLRHYPAADSASDFPGLFVQFVSIEEDGGAPRRWTVLVFEGPICVFVGWKTIEELHAVYYLVSPMLFLSTLPD